MADFSGHFIHLDQPILIENAIRGIVGQTPCEVEKQTIYAELDQE
jgi:hypothetical protein